MTHKIFRATALCSAILSVFMCANLSSRSSTEAVRRSEFDVRGASGVPKGAALRSPITAQLKALDSLQSAIGAPLEVRYNGLTATPNHLFGYSAYLTQPSSASPESIAREFLHKRRQIFRFSDEDLSSLKLRSRAYVPDIGTTILLFEQQVVSLPVYHGEVMVNVNRAGQIINVGGDSYPQLRITNQQALSPERAIGAAAAALGVTGFTPQPLGTKQVQVTFGDLALEFIEAPRFGGGGAFSDEIVVTRTAFPMGDTARVAYGFSLTIDGICWENIVDAETGEILRRTKQTAFLGAPGGGQGVGRRAAFRPDLQDRVEANNPAGTSAGKVFDGSPTILSGRMGFGMSPGAGIPPTYAPENATAQNSGRGFRFSLVSARTQSALVYNIPFGQVLRGFPDAVKPSPESPFGWFYLPTDSNGAEILIGNANRASTRGFGYAMADEARARNVAANSPVADKSQPFSATLTNLPSSAELFDARVLTSVFESQYTEGNNVVVSDDHQNDNAATHGVRGYAPNRQFTASHFDFTNGYEYGGVNAGGSPFFPGGALGDVYPGTLALFYYVNVLHDYWYNIGFTESLWNMQQDNFGRGGAGADAVIAQVQDRIGTNDANTTYPPDGTAPRFEALLFTQNALRRSDGAFEFDVIAHEIFHVVSSRSVSKGGTGCLAPPEVGEAFGQAEGYSDYIACSMADDDAVGEYVTGEFDKGIRRLPLTNYRWSYGAASNTMLLRRDRGQPDPGSPVRNFQVHDTGEIFGAILWDMRELMIMKNPGGAFFDGPRRLGGGGTFFIGGRRVQSVDDLHPIDYRDAFNTNDPATIAASRHIVRPGLVAAEIAERGNRKGPLCTAVATGATLADTLVLRALQLAPCNPSFIDSRDALLLADRELTGGENQAIIWRAFASHGVGAQASSSTTLTEETSQRVYLVVEDFSAPAGVTECEQVGPLAAPDFAARNLIDNTVTITINDGLPVRDAATYAISRGTSADGPFVKIAEIPAASTTFRDDNRGAGLSRGETFYYQVRATRNPQCVSPSNTRKIKITSGVEIIPPTAPTFSGLERVVDPVACGLLVLGWSSAGSANPDADIVYDVYRVDRVDAGNGTQEPSFIPSASNRVASGIRGTSFTDAGLATGRVYYYIVQARDLSNGRIDTGNAGNRVVKLNAPTSPSVTVPPVFAQENFESDSANNRFTPPLVESGDEPNDSLPAFQRVTNINNSAMMYAPDFDPAEFELGSQSDIAAVIGPLDLTSSSMAEFDHFFSTEASFDGGVIEVALGAPAFDSTPFPDNTTTFDVGNYIVEGGYNGRLDGVLVSVGSGVMSSALQGRRAYTGTKGLHHVRVALGAFAPGGANNPSGLPVYLRFRMTSDFSTNAGPNSGWYIGNLVINNLAACSPEQAHRNEVYDSGHAGSVSARRVECSGARKDLWRGCGGAEINPYDPQSGLPRVALRNSRRRSARCIDCGEG